MTPAQPQKCDYDVIGARFVAGLKVEREHFNNRHSSIPTAMEFHEPPFRRLCSFLFHEPPVLEDDPRSKLEDVCLNATVSELL